MPSAGDGVWIHLVGVSFMERRYLCQSEHDTSTIWAKNPAEAKCKYLRLLKEKENR